MPLAKMKAGKGKAKKVTPEMVRPGGIGLKLMHRIFDEVHITAGEKRGNRVRMRLFL
jgi:anti-sigma regulatory factor (Ser/Thr protein kinase)